MATRKQSKRKAVPRAPKTDDFESVAKRLECDTDMDKFKEKLGKIARAKVKIGER